VIGALALVSVLVYHDSARWVGSAWLIVGVGGYAVYRLVFEEIGMNRHVTVDPRSLTRPHLKAGLSRIMVPIFGTDLDEDIVSTAGLLAVDPRSDGSGGGAELVLLYTVEVPMSLGIHDPLPDEVEAEARRATERAADIAREYSGVKVKTRIARVRRTGSGIVFAAGEMRADAIVLGAEPPNPIRGGARLGGVGEVRPEEVGPVTAYVLKRAPCQVLLTAPPTGEA
jgi:APA family basic amino acid/polyamine antiporter